MKIDKNTLLQVAPKLIVNLESQSIVKVIGDHLDYTGSQLTLSIMNTFYLQRSFEDGINILSKDSPGQMQWMRMVNEIKRLHSLQILQSPNELKPIVKSHPGRFDSAPVHIRMLNDTQRTMKYQQAIRETVGPNDIVLDIGTGTGVLAMTAAKAGAKHVYAIERTALGKIAKESFAKNGLSDKITLIEGDSREITLPEKATILISEIIGNDPLREGILPTTKDAVTRHLINNAKLIPSNLSLYGIPITVPKDVLAANFFNGEMIQNWKELYDLDFSQLQETFETKKSNVLMKSSYKMKGWPLLSAPILLKDIDLSNIDTTIIKSEKSLTINKEGVFNGLLLYFSAELPPRIELSMHPDKVNKTNSWQSLICVPNEQWKVSKGDVFKLDYSFINKSNFTIIKEK